jgi:hypothetical protein
VVGVIGAVILIAVAARWSKTAEYVSKLVPSGAKAGG